MTSQMLFHLKYESSSCNRWCEEEPDVPIVLDGADLFGADLTGARVSSEDLKGALHVAPSLPR